MQTIHDNEHLEEVQQAARRRDVEALVATYRPDENPLDVDEPIGRYALLESFEGREEQWWLTTHASPEEAGDYSGETYEDSHYEAELLIDLDTGEQMLPTRTVVTTYVWRPRGAST